MKLSRQALLGVAMMLGGSVMLYAMIQQVGSTADQQVSTQTEQPEPVILEPVAPVRNTTALTTDIETERRILAEKQRQREARVAEQERKTKAFLAEQERAEAVALAKARAENEQYNDTAVEPIADSRLEEHNTLGNDNETNTQDAAHASIVKPIVKPRLDNRDNNTDDLAAQNLQTKLEKSRQAKLQKEAEERAKAEKAKQRAEEKARLAAQAKKQEEKKKAQAEAKAKREAEKAKREAEKAKSKAAPSNPIDYTVKRGDGLIRLARQHNVPVEALAQANNLSTRANLHVGQKLTIPSKRQIAQLEREAAQAQKKRQQEAERAKKSAQAKREAQQKLKEARKEVKKTDAKGSFGVQVALASNQAKADEVAKKFQAAGYQVKTSRTSRGVRVMIGPERGKVAALALKDKINSDPKVNTSNAWVLYWR